MDTLNYTDSQRRFKDALNSVLYGFNDDLGIGTLSERTLHAVLKRYFEPSALSREVKIGRYVADIVGEDGIIEIQTGALARLRPKLDAFLEAARVTVVYPLAVEARVFCTGADGMQQQGRAKRRNPMSVFEELYPIRDLLSHPNLTLRVMHLKVDEVYRQSEVSGLKTKRRGKLRGTRRADRIPIELITEQVYEHPLDYLALFPDLPQPFCAADLAGAVRISATCARMALNIAELLGFTERIGRDKAGYQYRYLDV